MPFFRQPKQGVSKLHFVFAALQAWQDLGRVRLRLPQYLTWRLRESSESGHEGQIAVNRGSMSLTGSEGLGTQVTVIEWLKLRRSQGLSLIHRVHVQLGLLGQVTL